MEICVRYQHSTKGKVKRIYSVFNVRRVYHLVSCYLTVARLKSSFIINDIIEIFVIVTLKGFKITCKRPNGNIRHYGTLLDTMQHI